MNDAEISKVLAALYGMHEGVVLKVIEGASALRGVVLHTPAPAPMPLPQSAPVHAATMPAPRVRQMPSVSRPHTPKNAHAQTYQTILEFIAHGRPVGGSDIQKLIGASLQDTWNRIATICKKRWAVRAERGRIRITAEGLKAIGKTPAPPRVDPPPTTEPMPALPAPATAKRGPKHPADAPFITDHARQRYAEHHDDNSLAVMIDAWNRGIDMDAGTVAAMTNEAKRLKGSLFRLASDRRGIFVATKREDRSFVVVTYLRLTEKHQEWCREQWPVEAIQ